MALNSVKVYAVVENGVVTNMIVAEDEFAAQRKDIFLAKDGVQIGWRYAKGKFTPPPRDMDGEWEVVREQRNKLLSECDYVVLPDYWATLSKEQQNAWVSYRKQLREITKNFTDPQEVVFPEKP